MKIAFSPCPNDTFVFHAWVHGLIPDAQVPEVVFADIDITNQWALELNGPDLMKISYAALPWVLDKYTLLPCGGALGRGCGPLVLTRSEETPEMLSGKTVAVPSERSTAYLLFRLWAAEQVPAGFGNIKVMPFHEIMPAVQDGKVDVGLVIHEARFTYQNYQLHMLCDLGTWWEQDTGLPIPLGAIIARRSLDHLDQITGWIRDSVSYGWEHPRASLSYVMQHAQEMSPEVASAHIQLYVNEFTHSLGAAGYRAVQFLLERAAQEELVPPIDWAKI